MNESVSIQGRLKRLVLMCAMGLMASGSLLTAGCESGSSGGDVPPNASTMSGTVDAFVGAQAAFVAEDQPVGLVAVWRGVTEWLVPSAHAAVEGVGVQVAGRSASTAEDGLFVIAGVPPGSQEVIFTMGPDRASLMVDVPPNATVDLRGIHVMDGVVGVGRVDVAMHEDHDSDGTSDGTSDDGDSIDDEASVDSDEDEGHEHAVPEDGDSSGHSSS